MPPVKNDVFLVEGSSLHTFAVSEIKSGRKQTYLPTNLAPMANQAFSRYRMNIVLVRAEDKADIGHTVKFLQELGMHDVCRGFEVIHVWRLGD